MAQRLLAKTARFGILGQTGWDVLRTASSNFESVLNNAKVTIPDPAVNVSTFDYLSSDGLLQEANRQYVDRYAELKSVPFSGFAYKGALQLELPLILQKVTSYSTYSVIVTDGSATIEIADTTGFAIGQTISIANMTFGTSSDTTAIITTVNEDVSIVLNKVVNCNINTTVSGSSGTSLLITDNTSGFAEGQIIAISGTTFEGDNVATILSVDDNVSISIDKELDNDVSSELVYVVSGTLTINDYPKEFTLNNTVIDFKNGEGYVAGVAYQTYNGTSAGDGFLLHNAILDSYTLSINNEGTGTDKLLKREGVWKGNKIEEALDFTGTWVDVPASPTYYKHFNLKLTIGSTNYTNICWKNFSMKIDRNVTPICMVNGIATNYLTQPTIEVTIDIPYTSENYTIFQAYAAGTNVGFELTSYPDGIENPYHGNNFKIQSNSGILKSNPYQYDGEYLALRLTFDITKPASGDIIPLVICGS